MKLQTGITILFGGDNVCLNATFMKDSYQIIVDRKGLSYRVGSVHYSEVFELFLATPVSGDRL